MSDGYLCHGGEQCVHGADSTHWVNAAPTRLWVLGADDPEMTAIERLLRQAGEAVAYAVGLDGKRVHPGNAYAATGWSQEPPCEYLSIIAVECGMVDQFRQFEIGGGSVTVVDHHRPGDPGHGIPPERFLEGSSIGQVLNTLARVGSVEDALAVFTARLGWVSAQGDGSSYGNRGIVSGRICLSPGSHGEDGEEASLWVDIPQNIVFVAAADHCLEAAYRGRCPGVDPDALMRWRAESRAAFQKRPVGDVLADIEAARRVLRESVGCCPSCRGRGDSPYGSYMCEKCNGTGQGPVSDFADLRGQHVPELPEAACREGIPFLSTVKDRDGREKVVLQAAPSDLVRRFLAGEIVPGLCDMYGSPERGMAGGYLTKKE